MFILHFNRLIRNKWVWGVFAVVISIFFVSSDYLFTDDQGSRTGTAGKLGGKDFSGPEFDAIATDIRGFGRQRDNRTSAAVVNRSAWEIAAALRTATDDRLLATDDEVRETIRRDRAFQDERGAFSLDRYQSLLRENELSPERFESYMSRMITLQKISGAVLGSATWVSPMELESAQADMTDRYTVRVATFHNKAPAGKKVGDAELLKFYEAHTNAFVLPDLVRVRYVAFRADDPARLATMKVSDDELRDRYDATGARFEKQTTNGVVRQTFEEVKPILLQELRQIALLDADYTNLTFRAYANASTNAAAPSRLEKIAAEEKLTVHTSPFFCAEGTVQVPGFMSATETFAPGAPGFAAAAFELDPQSSDLRYGVVRATNAVYLIERAAFAPAHLPSFAEAKDAIRPEAEAVAREDAFKEEVDKIRAHAAAALAKGQPFDAKTLAGASVSTAMTFSVSALARGSFPDVESVAGAVIKLGKGQISDFIVTSSPDRALLVYVADRRAGDAATAQMVAAQLRDDLASVVSRTLMPAWQAWNLARVGFEPSSSAAVGAADAGAVQED